MSTQVTVENVDAITGGDIEVENIYDEVEIDDLDFDEDEKTFFYPCPCGDKFRITLLQMKNGESIARCPSCSLKIKIISDEEALQEFFEDNGIEF